MLQRKRDREQMAAEKTKKEPVAKKIKRELPEEISEEAIVKIVEKINNAEYAAKQTEAVFPALIVARDEAGKGRRDQGRHTISHYW